MSDLDTAPSPSRSASLRQAEEIVGFWRDAGPGKWFVHDADFDAAFESRFLDLHFAAARRELEAWLDHAQGALALLLLLDQLPRNVFRDSGHAYATDPLARQYAARAIAAGFDAAIDPALRVFFYLPYEHSEDIADQDRAVALVGAVGGEFLTYAIAHRDVIARFGRFPHRNRALGRESSADEQAYLAAGGGFG